MPLSSQQKAAVTQFVSFTQADKKTAEKLLKAHNWDIQRAANVYLSSSSSRSGPDPHAANLNKLFDGYRDDVQNYPDTVRIDGMMKYLEDLGVALDDINMLVVSELVKSPTMGEFQREGFVSGWSSKGASTIAAQKTALANVKKDLSTPSARSGTDAPFTRVYRHTFLIGLTPGSRVMPLDSATEYWKLLLGEQGFNWVGKTGTPWLDWWLECLEKKNRPINKDLWNQTLRVADKVLEDETLSWWNEEESWPSAVDEFVQWAKTEKGIGKSEAMDVDS